MKRYLLNATGAVLIIGVICMLGACSGSTQNSSPSVSQTETPSASQEIESEQPSIANDQATESPPPPRSPELTDEKGYAAILSAEDIEGAKAAALAYYKGTPFTLTSELILVDDAVIGEYTEYYGDAADMGYIKGNIVVLKVETADYKGLYRMIMVVRENKQSDWIVPMGREGF